MAFTGKEPTGVEVSQQTKQLQGDLKKIQMLRDESCQSDMESKVL